MLLLAPDVRNPEELDRNTILQSGIGLYPFVPTSREFRKIYRLYLWRARVTENRMPPLSEGTTQGGESVLASHRPDR